MTGGKRTALVLSSLVLALALAGLSRVPYTPVATQHALLRLSWRYRAEPIETCRALTQQERSTLPIHMQRDTICEGKAPTYRLRLAVDGDLVDDSRVVAAGARQDRPMFVFRELRLDAGEHRLEVAFEPDDAADPGDRSGSAPPAANPPAEGAFRLFTTVTVESRDVVLVTYDGARDALVLRRE